MKANIVRIGNSKGIRLPKPVLEQCGLEESVEIEIEGNRLVIRPVRRPRSAWGKAFLKMAQHKDDALLDRDSSQATAWDKAEWRW